MKLLFWSSCLSLLLSSHGVFANCDAKHLLTRLDGAMSSGAIDGSVLTYSARERFFGSFLAECPALRQKYNSSMLSAFLEKVTGGWDVRELDWKSSLERNYYGLKQRGLLNDLNQIDDVVSEIDSNSLGLCKPDEVVRRFLTIGDCSVPIPKTGGWSNIHLCVTNIVTQKSLYVHYLDLCPQIKLPWEDIRESVVAAKNKHKMMASRIGLHSSPAEYLARGRTHHTPIYKSAMADHIGKNWKRFEAVKR